MPAPPPPEEVRKRCAAINSRLGTKMAIADSEVGGGAVAGAKLAQNSQDQGSARWALGSLSGATPWVNVALGNQGREGCQRLEQWPCCSSQTQPHSLRLT